MLNLLSYVDSLNSEKLKEIPDFKAGDTIKVYLKIKEGEKVRTQIFAGTVVQRRHPGTSGETFTIIKFVNDVAVERIFPILCPNIEKIEIVMQGSVRRARIFYIRSRRGKSTKIKEKKIKK